MPFSFTSYLLLSIITPSWCDGAAAPPPTYSVNLDDPPAERWKTVLEDFIGRNGISAFEQTYTEWYTWIGNLLPDVFAPGVDSSSTSRLLAAFQHGHPDLVAELQTLSKVLRAHKASPVFELPVLAAATAGYVVGNISPKNSTDTKPHFASACTSTVVRSADGHVLHGRSLDYEPRNAMAKTTVNVNFAHKNSASSGYTCLHPLVYPTALQWFTCLRPGQFSLSVNARGQGKWTEHNTTFDELLKRLENPSAMLLGEAAQAAMETADYNKALTSLVSVPVISSNYFILAGAGKGQGSIITRYGNNSGADVWSLDSGSSDGQPSWLRVQTNVDHWVSYQSGAYATHRRQHAVDLFSNISQESIGEKELWSVYKTVSALDLPSVARKSPEDTGAILRPTTISTSVISPSNGTFNSCVWLSSAELGPPLSSHAPAPALPKCYGDAQSRQRVASADIVV